MLRSTALFIALAAVVMAAQSQAPGQPAPGQPARDTPAQQSAEPQTPPTASVTGRVVAADGGRPVSRARVSLSSPQGGGRATLTDDTGAFTLTDLPEGRYTLQVSKPGFITLQYGQRRPLQAGTPIQLAAGQALRGADFSLPRGGAISGRVLDENSEPMPGVSVRVLEYRYAQGARTLSPTGSAQTDDRGEYRVWGLNPGDYYVSVTPPPALGNAFVGRGLGAPGAGRGGARGAGGGDDPQSLGYAPTYYPGVMSVSDARPVTVGLSTEVTEISFSVSLVRTAHVSGRVVNADGTAAAGVLSLAPDDSGRNGGLGGRGFSAPVMGDGQFTFANIPPGRYTLRARSGNGGGRGRGNPNQPPMFASTPVFVTGDDITGVSLVLAPGAGLSGSATFETTQAAPPNINQFRVTAPSTKPDGTGNGQTQLDARTGTFNMDGLAPGEHILQVQTPRGWSLKSVTIDGRDLTDIPFELKSGQKITTVALVFTDKITQIQGTVADTKGDPVTDFTVLAFAQDESLWRPQSREIMTARPDQNGQYQIRGLPSGQYYIALVDPTAPGEWFDPAFLTAQRVGAQRIQLADGDVRTQDFTISR
jgi:protocatechuate 3,4-dioxygenase beta subunit